MIQVVTKWFNSLFILCTKWTAVCVGYSYSYTHSHAQCTHTDNVILLLS